MAPAQPSVLKKIRKQGALQRRATAGSLAGSACDRISKDNEIFEYGCERASRDFGGEIQAVPKEQVKKRKITKTRKIPIKKAKAPLEPREPIVESWRPAGGEDHTDRKKKEVLTATLGIARISTWRLQLFLTAVKDVIEEHGEIEDIETSELVHGGEIMTDVNVSFRSELVAEAVVEKINGEILQGRKLQVKFV